MPLNYTIPALNTWGVFPYYCTAGSYSMFYMWQKEGCGREGEEKIDLQQILYNFEEMYEFVCAGE